MKLLLTLALMMAGTQAYAEDKCTLFSVLGFKEPCSQGPYHINTGGSGPDLGVTPSTPKKIKSNKPVTEPETGPDDDGVGGPYDGYDTPREG